MGRVVFGEVLITECNGDVTPAIADVLAPVHERHLTELLNRKCLRFYSQAVSASLHAGGRKSPWHHTFYSDQYQ